MNVLEAIARQALLRPGAEALIGGSRVLTYRELIANVAVLASRMAEAGIVRGDVVAIVAPGLLRHVLITLALAHLGAVSLPLSARRDADDAALAQACGAKFLVHTQAEGFRLEVPCIERQMSLASLIAQAPQCVRPMVASEPGDWFRIGLSSGTTGGAKAIRFTHGSTILRTHLTTTVFPSGPQERMLVDLGPSLHFAVGYWLRVLTCGGTAIATSATPMETLRRHRVTFPLTNPVNATELLKIARSDPRFADPPPSLKTLCVGGAAVAPALQAQFRRHLCPNLCINYGSTEGGLMALADPSVLDRDPTSAGRTLPWVELQAVDADGRPLPAGQPGLLRVRSPTMAAGYVEGTGPADAFRDGWFYSGDRGQVTPDGLVHLAGRAGELYIAGRKVDASRIEAVIAQDPSIHECVAIAMPDRIGEPQLLAVVVAPEGLDRQALKQRCAQTLGAPLVPRAVIVVNALPHNEAGKVLRHEVVAMIERHRAARSGAADPAGAA